MPSALAADPHSAAASCTRESGRGLLTPARGATEMHPQMLGGCLASHMQSPGFSLQEVLENLPGSQKSDRDSGKERQGAWEESSGHEGWEKAFCPWPGRW